MTVDTGIDVRYTRRVPANTYEVLPGDILSEKLHEMGMTQVEFARRTGLSTKHVNKVIKGHATFSPACAIRFERVTGVSARLWLALQSDYLLGQARLAEEAT